VAGLHIGDIFCHTERIMPSPPRVIAFLTASPFELLDLTGRGCFLHPIDKRQAQLLSANLVHNVVHSVRSTMALQSPMPANSTVRPARFDTLIAIGGEGSLEHQSASCYSGCASGRLCPARASVCTGAFILLPQEYSTGEG